MKLIPMILLVLLMVCLPSQAAERVPFGITRAQADKFTKDNIWNKHRSGYIGDWHGIPCLIELGFNDHKRLDHMSLHIIKSYVNLGKVLSLLKKDYGQFNKHYELPQYTCESKKFLVVLDVTSDGYFITVWDPKVK